MEFIDLFGYDYTMMVSAAGRVNLIGEHIDYCGGKVFPVSLNLSCKVYSSKNNSGIINMAFKGIKDIVTLDLNHLDSYHNIGIGSYQAGVFYTLEKLGYNITGMDMYYDCDIPFGGGLSSSAGIEVATMITMLETMGYKYSLRDVALWCQKTENEYCNVNCGIMDQYASANGKKNMAMLLDCKKVSHTYIPCDLKNYSLLVCNTNKPHSLVKSEYNTRRKEVEKALLLLKQKNDIDCLADLSVEQFEKTKYVIDDEVILKRATHVIYECDRVNKSAEKLVSGDIQGFGKLLNESHYSLKDNYETTGIELDTLTDLMRKSDGCIGARMTGAGFGGSCICLVQKGKEQNLKNYVTQNYERIIGYKPSFYDVTIEDGVKIIKK